MLPQFLGLLNLLSPFSETLYLLPFTLLASICPLDFITSLEVFPSLQAQAGIPVIYIIAWPQVLLLSLIISDFLCEGIDFVYFCSHCLPVTK